MSPNFGSGVLTNSLLGVTSQARDTYVNSNGSIYVVGRTQAVAGQWQLALTRYNPDGSLDTSFATNGIWIQSLVGNEDSPYKLAMDSQARVVVGGRSDNGTDLDFAIWRYHSNGTPDTSFAGTGFTRASFGAIFDVGRTLSLDTSGRLMVAGYSLNGNTFQVALARMSTNGEFDTSFSSSGKLTLSFTTNATADVVQFNSAGRIQFGGLHGGNSLVGRLISNGSWDTSFFTQGFTEFTFSGGGNSAIRDLKFNTRGALVGAGYHGARGVRNFLIFRLRTDNAGLDTRFGTAGLVNHGFSTAGSESVRLYIGTDNKIMAAGYRNSATTGKDLALLRYNSNGTTDTSWTTTLTTSAGDDTPWGMSNLKNQEYLVAGQVGAADSGQWMLARFNGRGGLAPSGSLELTFASGGFGPPSALSIGGSTQANAVLAQTDGKMLYAGVSPGFPPLLNVSRWLPSGSLDTSFSGDGLATFTSFNYAATRDLQQLPDGSYSATMASRIVYRFASNGSFTTFFQSPNAWAAGTTTYDSSFRAYTSGAILTTTLSVRRHNPDGSDDTSFATTGTTAPIVFFRTGIGGVIDHKFVQPDGKLQVAFSPFTGNVGVTAGIIRFLTNGQVDTAYGENGILPIESGGTPLGATLGIVRYFNSQPDGFIVGEGLDFDGVYGYAFTRYLLTGALDTSFGYGGRYEYVVGLSDFNPNVLEPTRGGRYLGVNIGTNGPGAFSQAFRLNSDFSLDTSFATRGYAGLSIQFENFSPTFHSSDIGEQPDGFIIYVRKNAIRYFP